MSTLTEKIPEVKQKDLVEKFANGLANYQTHLVEPLLAEDGEYTYYELDGNEIEDGSKADFIDYLNRICDPLKFTATEPALVEFDQCLFCKTGNPVVLMNRGTFPHQSTQLGEQEKYGLMLEFEGDMISGVTFCVSFLRNNNRFRFETENPFGDRDFFHNPLSKEEIEDLFISRVLMDLDEIAGSNDETGSCGQSNVC